MAFGRFLCLLAVSAIYVVECVENSGNVPVFIWGDVVKTSLAPNPLQPLDSEKFQSLFKTELEADPFTVVFVEETLSVEDFSRKNSEGATSYPFLHSTISGAIYLPSVESALSSIDQLAPEAVDRVKLTENGLSAEIEPNSGKFLFINLEDAKESESRAEMLRRHDDFMQSMIGKLKESYTKVIAVYTAQYPSWTLSESHRVKRQANTGNTWSLEKLLLYVNDLVLVDGDRTTKLSKPVSYTSNLNGTELIVKLTFDGNTVLSLYFPQSMGYWFFNKVELIDANQATEILQPDLDVHAVNGFSYRCGQSVSFNSVNTSKAYSVTFNDIKVQPFHNANSTDNLTFGDSYNCVGFFSAPIWAGLMVSFILLAITFFGIMMMFDIRTMDRFDDPKALVGEARVSKRLLQQRSILPPQP